MFNNVKLNFRQNWSHSVFVVDPTIYVFKKNEARFELHINEGVVVT
jgi:hypothetical protein